MQPNNHSSNNEHLNFSSLFADDNGAPSLPSDPLEPLIKETIKNLLFSNNETSDIPPGHKNPDSTSTSSNTSKSFSDQQEERFKARSHQRYAQEFSDTFNAQRFVSLHRDRLRYIPQSDSWMFWDGQRWSPDIYNIDAFARATFQSFRDEALALPYEQRQRSTQLFNHAERSDTPKRLHAMLDLARHDPALIASPHTFDSDPLLLNVLNGTIDLRTARLQPHNPQDFITHLAPVTYDPAACSPVWDKFLLDITHQDPALQHFLQLAVGYSLTSRIQEQAIFLLYGPGGNGKSTFLNIIGSLLGDYTGYASGDLITTKSSSASSLPPPTSLSRKRFLIIPELGSDRTFDTLAFKYITDGMLFIRSAEATSLSFPQPVQHSFKLWMATNHLPTIRDYSDAAWRRIRLIHFPVSFRGREDKDLVTKLQVSASASAILNWALQGCLIWQREGLSLPDCIQQATTSYQDEQDELACFLRTCCQFGPNHSIKASDLYQAYQLWCQEIGENNPLCAKSFCHHIIAHGYLRIRKKTGIIYSGFSLINPPVPPPLTLRSLSPNFPNDLEKFPPDERV
jgi:putative DNA primase/helicase